MRQNITSKMSLLVCSLMDFLSSESDTELILSILSIAQAVFCDIVAEAEQDSSSVFDFTEFFSEQRISIKPFILSSCANHFKEGRRGSELPSK